MEFLYENLKSPNGKLVRATNIKKNYPNEYHNIVKYSKTHNIEELSFPQKVWIYLHDSKGIPNCKCCSNKVRFESYNYGYKTYCSAKCAANDKELSERKKATNLKRYGSEYIGSSKQLQEKRKKTMLARYNVENPMDVPAFVEKIKTTMMKNHGVENAMHLEKFKKKAMDTNIRNNGTFSLNKQESRDKRYKVIVKIFLKGYEDTNFINYTGNKLEIQCDKCNKNYIIDRSTFRFRHMNNITTCTHCNPIGVKDSFGEQELKTFITSLDTAFISNDRNLIAPKELDILIPSKKIAIEYDGLFWHSDKFVESDYHLNKTKMCNTMGYKLLHIFEDEWANKKSIVKSIVKRSLGYVGNRIYGRKCIIKEIDTQTSRTFINKNHIQGYVNSNHKYGLYFNEELVAIMTFGSLRKIMGNISKPNEYEMLRFCSKLDTQVIGGASKLFKHFLRTHNPKKIISYANRRYFDGKMYTSMGMKFIGETKPNYYYYDGKTVTREHRYKYRKDMLVKRGYNKNKSEREIMKNLGYYRIYDCGTYKYEWK